jgi:hypothetical protein
VTDSNVAVSPSVMSPLEAFESLSEEIGEVQEADLVRINLDVPTLVITANHAVSQLRALKPAFKAALKDYEVTEIDKLGAYAQALDHAHTLYLAVALSRELMPELVQQATHLRDTLYSDVTALVTRGLLDESSLRNVRTANGYRPLATDLTVLAQVLTDHWKSVKSKTAVNEQDLDTARALAARVKHVLAQIDEDPSLLAERTLNRQRAYTLFFHAYDRARRAILYVRWEQDDADDFVPSLFAGRGAGRRKADADPPVTTTPVSPAPTTPAGIPPVGASGFPTGVTPIGPAANGASAAAPIPVGHPGSDPFVRA